MKLIQCFGAALAMILACVSCAFNEYYSVSDFKLDTDSLPSNAPLRLLYYNASEVTQDSDFYLHLMVKRLPQGDTFNILTPFNHGFAPSDRRFTYTFISEHEDYFIEMNKMKFAISGDSIVVLSGNSPKRLKKVLKILQHTYLTDNDYPTVIGMLTTDSSNIINLEREMNNILSQGDNPVAP